MTQEKPRAPGAFPKAGALLVTNSVKVAGAVIAVNEAFTTKDAVVIALAAFMMAGAQVSEPLVMAIFDRILGGGGK